MLKLINAQAVPNLIYGISAATLTTQEIKSLSYAYNSVFTKMFNTFDKNVIYCCQFYSGYLCFNMLYDLHRYMFLRNLLRKTFIDKCSEIDKFDYRDYVALQNKYDFKDSDSEAKIKFKVWNVFALVLMSCLLMSKELR